MPGCPRCGQYNPQRANYCMFCGQNLRERTVKVREKKQQHLALKGKKNELLYKMVASIVIAGFLLYLLAIAYLTEYHIDYFGRGVAVVLVVLLVAALIGITYYTRKFRQLSRYLSRELRAENDQYE